MIAWVGPPLQAEDCCSDLSDQDAVLPGVCEHPGHGALQAGEEGGHWVGVVAVLQVHTQDCSAGSLQFTAVRQYYSNVKQNEMSYLAFLSRPAEHRRFHISY